VLFVERQFAPAQGGQVQVGARFMRYSGIANGALSEVLGLVSAPQTLGCSVRDTGGSSAEPPPRAQIQLLDVGRIEVQTERDGILLEPRRLPDLFHVVSGVVYAGEGAFTGNLWRFRADGSGASRVPAFELSARGPDVVTNVVVGQQSATQAEAINGLALPEGAFVVRWSRAERPEPSDRVMVEFVSPTTATVVCVADDNVGFVEVSAALRERMNARDTVLVVHRLRSRNFALASMEQAAMVFDFSLRVPLH
jgi:hypothetical protein